MKFTIIKTDESLFEGVVESYSNFHSNMMADTLNYYYLIHIKPKPKYLPSFIHTWLIKKLMYTVMFQKKLK